jgi:hypothetical protein
VTSYRCLTFLTDFGLDDGFVAACHGVAMRIAPGTPVIDITHLVPAGDVRRGATVLAQTLPAMPPAVHVAVVDPGVGTRRRPVAVRAGEAILVGPDNGLLSWAADALGGASEARLLSNEALWNHPVARTFHGRDIFMPAAAHLAAGTDLGQAGTEISPVELVTLPAPVSRVTGAGAECEVLSVDRFGNIQLSMTALAAAEAGVTLGSPVTVQYGRHELSVPFLETFGSARPGILLIYTDSAGLISLAVSSGNAAGMLDLAPGAQVVLSTG